MRVQILNGLSTLHYITGSHWCQFTVINHAKKSRPGRPTNPITPYKYNMNQGAKDFRDASFEDAFSQTMAKHTKSYLKTLTR